MKQIGFTQLEDGMVIEMNTEKGTEKFMVKEIEVPSPNHIGSDFFYQVKAFAFHHFTMSGKNYIPVEPPAGMYIDGFPTQSSITPVDFSLLGFYSVVYTKDDSRKLTNATPAPEDVLMSALENMDPDKLSKILATLQAAAGKEKK